MHSLALATPKTSLFDRNRVDIPTANETQRKGLIRACSAIFGVDIPMALLLSFGYVILQLFTVHFCYVLSNDTHLAIIGRQPPPIYIMFHSFFLSLDDTTKIIIL